MEENKTALKIYHILTKAYPQAHIRLEHSSPFELLIAAVLAGQSSEDKVNPVTKNLFKKYPTVYDLSKAETEDIEEIIKTTSVYKGKAQSIKSISKMIIKDHNNRFPNTVQKLTAFPGVGIRTAKLVLANCFYYPAVLIDAHIKRIIVRLGITEGTSPEDIEGELEKKLSKSKWTRFSLILGEHGRNICTKIPKCSECKLTSFCNYYMENIKK